MYPENVTFIWSRNQPTGMSILKGVMEGGPCLLAFRKSASVHGAHVMEPFGLALLSCSCCHQERKNAIPSSLSQHEKNDKNCFSYTFLLLLWYSGHDKGLWNPRPINKLKYVSLTNHKSKPLTNSVARSKSQQTSSAHPFLKHRNSHTVNIMVTTKAASAQLGTAFAQM